MKINFITDFLQRLFKDNPKGWKYFQIFCFAVFILSWVLDDMQNLPAWLEMLQGKVAKVSAALLTILAQLPNSSDASKNQPEQSAE